MVTEHDLIAGVATGGQPAVAEVRGQADAGLEGALVSRAGHFTDLTRLHVLSLFCKQCHRSFDVDLLSLQGKIDEIMGNKCAIVHARALCSVIAMLQQSWNV